MSEAYKKELNSHENFQSVEVQFEHKKVKAHQTKNGAILIQGDVKIHPDSLKVVKEGLFKGSYDKHVNRWSDSTVPFEIESSMDNNLKDLVHEAIKQLNDKTNLTLVQRTVETDYLFFQDSGFCASYIGKQGGKQEIDLSEYAVVGNIIHEICHAVGLHHEHSRHDRGTYIEVFLDNVEDEDDKNNFDIEVDGEDYGDYNYGSIMHYGEDAFAKDGEITIKPKQDGVTIGQRERLSQGDIDTINSLYAKVLS